MTITYLVNYWKGNESVVVLKESSMAPDTCGFSLQSLSPLIKKKKKKKRQRQRNDLPDATVAANGKDKARTWLLMSLAFPQLHFEILLNSPW